MANVGALDASIRRRTKSSDFQTAGRRARALAVGSTIERGEVGGPPALANSAPAPPSHLPAISCPRPASALATSLKKSPMSVGGLLTCLRTGKHTQEPAGVRRQGGNLAARESSASHQKRFPSFLGSNVQLVGSFAKTNNVSPNQTSLHYSYFLDFSNGNARQTRATGRISLRRSVKTGWLLRQGPYLDGEGACTHASDVSGVNAISGAKDAY